MTARVFARWAAGPACRAQRLSRRLDFTHYAALDRVLDITGWQAGLARRARPRFGPMNRACLEHMSEREVHAAREAVGVLKGVAYHTVDWWEKDGSMEIPCGDDSLSDALAGLVGAGPWMFWDTLLDPARAQAYLNHGKWEESFSYAVPSNLDRGKLDPKAGFWGEWIDRCDRLVASAFVPADLAPPAVVSAFRAALAQFRAGDPAGLVAPPDGSGWRPVLEKLVDRVPDLRADKWALYNLVTDTTEWLGPPPPMWEER